MSELRELYQQVILDHNKNPRNFGPLAGANRHQEGFNPLCGDPRHVYLSLDDDRVIEDIHFDGSGCAISKASASLMTQLLKGKTAQEAKAGWTSGLPIALKSMSRSGKPRTWACR